VFTARYGLNAHNTGKAYGVQRYISNPHEPPQIKQLLLCLLKKHSIRVYGNLEVQHHIVSRWRQVVNLALGAHWVVQKLVRTVWGTE
jgi:hypothetical protein